MIEPYVLALHGACSSASGDGSSDRLIDTLADFKGDVHTPLTLKSALEGHCVDCDLLPEALFMRHPHLAANPPPPPPPPLPPPPVSLPSARSVPTHQQSRQRIEMSSSRQVKDSLPQGGAVANSATRGGLFVSAKDSFRDKSGRKNEADWEMEPDQGPSLPTQKRKFNCPTPNGQDPKLPAHEPTSNGGRGIVPSSSSSNGHGKAHQQPSSYSPEDDLPEKLRGCDPKLVSMIENEILVSGQPVTFSDISGLAEAKQGVYELVCWPMKRPELFTGLRSLPKGLLLFGPPGTGKTLIGKAIAHESGATFFSISASSLMSKWTGESERLVKTLFAVASHREPSVVFLDEVDSLLTARSSEENEASRRLKTEFLVQLDGAATPNDRVLVVGATNRPHELDEAARRRFVKKLYIPLPDESGRRDLVSLLMSKNLNSLSTQDIDDISLKTDGYSGADIRSLCQEAAMGPIRESVSRLRNIEEADLPPISPDHFASALRQVRPSVALKDLDLYVKWNQEFGTFSRKS